MKKIDTMLYCMSILFLLWGVSFAQPKINEAFSRGTTAEPDWIEIYNSSSSQIDISAYKIYDNGGQSGTKPKKLFPSGALLPANGFYVIMVDLTGDPSDFGLGSGGDKAWLEDVSGVLVDSIIIPAITDTAASFGRLPDGSNNWQLLIPRTRGSSNSATDVNDEFGSTFTYVLNQNYPNPFNPSTTISYQIAQNGFVTLKLFNILGKEVAFLVNEIQNAGSYKIEFDGKNLSSGIYLYQLNVGSFSDTKKLTLMK
jgi:hypothetical protein